MTPRACLSVWLQQSGVVKLQGMMTHSAELGKPAHRLTGADEPEDLGPEWEWPLLAIGDAEPASA
jgi:hypothetical protein